MFVSGERSPYSPDILLGRAVELGLLGPAVRLEELADVGFDVGGEGTVSRGHKIRQIPLLLHESPQPVIPSDHL